MKNSVKKYKMNLETFLNVSIVIVWIIFPVLGYVLGTTIIFNIDINDYQWRHAGRIFFGAVLPLIASFVVCTYSPSGRSAKWFIYGISLFCAYFSYSSAYRLYKGLEKDQGKIESIECREYTFSERRNSRSHCYLYALKMDSGKEYFIGRLNEKTKVHSSVNFIHNDNLILKTDNSP